MRNQLSSPQVAIVAAKRTPIGSFQGQFSHLRAPELAAKVLIDIFHHHQMHALLTEPGIDECLLGCVLSAGIGQAPARQSVLLAHLPENIPCTTINKVCGSGMKAVAMGMDAIRCGQENVVLAGGMESMSQAPYLFERRNQSQTGHAKVLDHLYFDGLENYYDGLLMGHFAELLVNRYPQKLSREQQDLFAMASLEKAKFASRMGYFKEQIVTIEGIDKDERVQKSQVGKIAGLKPAFHSDGTITAANASSLSDGAAILLLVEKELAENQSLPILAQLKGYSQYATQPEHYTTAPVYAIKALLDKLHWSISDVDLFEINEAFAVTTLATIAELEIPPEKVNIHGGACAMGHPIGASGARILVSLLYGLMAEEQERGIASVCIGGGEAMAVAMERN